MSMNRLRTTFAAAMGGAVLLAGLLVGASLAFAQESEDPDESTLDRLFDTVTDVATDPSSASAESLEEIVSDLVDEISPLVDEIKEKVLSAVDDAVAADALTAEQGEALKERISSFELPDDFPFPMHRFGLGDEGFAFDGDCFRFRFGPDGAEADGECPEFGEGFPFGPRGFEFDGRPFEFFGDRFDGFLQDLDLDLDLEGLRERLESGMNLDESLEDLDIDLDSLLSDAREEAAIELDQLVEDGKLSQERADWIKEMLEGIDLSGGVPFGLGDLSFEGFPFNDLEGFPFEHFENFDFEGFDFGDFDFFRGPGRPGHGFDFFGEHDDANAEDALLDV